MDTFATSARRPEIASVAELATTIARPGFEAVREMYEIRHVRGTPLAMSSSAWEVTSSVMNVPREAVENQFLFFVCDRFNGNEAIVNPLRSRRSAMPQSTATTTGRDRSTPAQPCAWCREWHVSRTDLWWDSWAAVNSCDGRIGTRPNWARQSTISGLAFGDEAMHDLDSLDESAFVGLFDAGESYLASARRAHRRAQFAMLFLNGGPKSAGSVEHAHVQIVAREDRHFSYPEAIARRCPPDYWQRLHRAHEQAGLLVAHSETIGWVNLAPVKERDVTVMSANVREGARSIYRIWRRLGECGTRNFSLAAILAPGYLSGARSPARFKQWPNVVWRFVDRGDPDVRHADIGSMELFASAVIAADPFAVAALLRDAAPRSTRAVCCQPAAPPRPGVRRTRNTGPRRKR